MDGERIRVRLAAEAGAEGLPVVIIKPGEANGLRFTARALAESAGLFLGAPVFIDHATPQDAARPGGRSVRDLAGEVRQAAWDDERDAVTGRLELFPAAGWVAELARRAGQRPYLGLSADLWVRQRGGEVQRIEGVNSVDIVVNPAAGGRFLGQQAVQTRREVPHMSEVETTTRVQTAHQEPPTHATQRDERGQEAARLGAEVQTLRAALLETQLARSGLPAPLQGQVRQQLAGREVSAEEIASTIAAYQHTWAEAQAQASIRGLGQIHGVTTPLERITLAFERLMGLPETAAHRAVERLTGIRELYDLLTGDWERHGLYRAERVTLANVTTTTMANVVANVLNKALLQAYTSRPQWWQPIAYEQEFTNMNQIKWLSLGGLADLDTVAEGDAYTEKTWDDNAESASFVKKGNYVGVTLEMIDRDDVAAVRAIPRRLGVAAYRTLSAAVAALFTANSGLGPALADGKTLFHADHGNLGSSALGPDSWDATIQAMFKQTELHSGKRLGLRPRYCLVPIELEKTALTIFTSDQEPGGDDNDANVRRNSSSVITVPDWTDAANWAAAADPGDLEGVCIGYRFGRAPEIFVADNELTGSMFTNDEMRIKVRFVYAVGIGDYRALYKHNIA